jgi:hypothetical protein
MSGKSKIKREQESLEAKQKEAVIADVLKFSKKRFKKFDEIILQLYKGENLGNYLTDLRIRKVNDCFGRLNSMGKSNERAILKDVFIHMHEVSTLLSGEEYIQVVFNMVLSRLEWRRDIFQWQPSSTRAVKQVYELAFYLFCRYEVPDFMYKSFFETTNVKFINWFIHMGTGKRVKELPDMPINFTQRMAHYFLKAPAKLSVTEALRWAQVKGMMGDDRLAERIACSWIGTKEYGDEDFWEGFIRIAINGGMYEYQKTGEVIDYLRSVKRENRGYSLKGRTMQSLIRRSDEWHRHSYWDKRNLSWHSSGTWKYKLDGREERVEMVELTDSKQLVQEGKTMRHCVASYAHYCVKGTTAIFSLRKYIGTLQTETLATIELNITLRKVVQAKYKMNRKISDEARKHLVAWAAKNQLTMSSYL